MDEIFIFRDLNFCNNVICYKLFHMIEIINTNIWLAVETLFSSQVILDLALFTWETLICLKSEIFEYAL